MSEFIPNESTFPEVDILKPLAEGLVIPLQNREVFATMHRKSHDTCRLYGVGHAALAVCYRSVLREDPSRVHATLLGCRIFEAISGVVSTRYYGDPWSLMVVGQLSLRLGDPESSRTLPDQLERAGVLLQEDVPVLGDAISEVAARELSGNSLGVLHALQGAGMMRDMQITADRVLAQVS